MTHPGVLGEGTVITLQGGLARRSRQLHTIHRANSTPEHAVLDPPTRLVLGVCAMDKKAHSKPMQEILQRMMSFNEFDVVVFGDKVILEEPVEKWPLCDCLLSWHSDHFPLAKAQAYVALRHPFCVNDVQQQELLLDRRKVYRTLVANGIPTPHHIIVSRDGEDGGQPLPQVGVDERTGAPVLADPPGFVEDNDHDFVEMNGVRIYKPFVEKPVDGEDHNIYIYYNHNHGGGVKRLFRKVDDKSGDYDPNHPGTIRRSGSYIYEEFLTTGGTDVKVYTVGPRYAHAEARKSPVVDGKVLRSTDGKEMRFPVLLSPQEKEISRMVCLAFSQKVCGFDLLRSEKGKSYVCDVNGWSFVKNSQKYYDDAAGILRSMILTALAPQRVMTLPMLLPGPLPGVREEHRTPSHTASASTVKAVESLQDMATLMEDDGRPSEELRCVLAVVRHGDRTPKQKIKIKVAQPSLLALFDKYRNSKGDQAKLKSPQQLQELLGVVRALLDSMDAALAAAADGMEAVPGGAVSPGADAAPPYTASPVPPGLLAVLGGVTDREALEELKERLTIVRTVLEQGGAQFSGVNRKVQLKPLRWRALDSAAHGTASHQHTALAAPLHAADVPDRGPGPRLAPQTSFGGAGFARSSVGGLPESRQPVAVGQTPALEQALLVVKWGGVLTHAGRQQAEQLGMFFRATMYPRYGPAGGGLLRLHSAYRHDLKIYSSDEGRVQVSAAAFAKGLLDLEGTSLTPILVSLVNKDASMLEAFGKGASEEMQACKRVIQAQLTHDLSKGPRPLVGSVSQQPSRAHTASPSPPMSPIPSFALRGAAPPPPPVPPTAAAPPPQSGLQDTLAVSAPGLNRVLAGWDASTVTSPVRPTSPLPLGLPGSSMQLLEAAVTDAEAKTGATTELLAGPTAQAPRPGPAAVPTAGSRPVALTTATATALDAGGAFAAVGRRAAAGPDHLPPQLSHSAAPTRAGSVTGDTAPPQLLVRMPSDPLGLLQRLKALMKQLVSQLAALCASHSTAANAAGVAVPPRLSGTYASHNQAPEAWELHPGTPCGGEGLVLLYDRWRKLYDALYSEKKAAFDISKIPDIYDSVKHDAIHNSHLGLQLQDIYDVAKALADVVIPNEYGLEAGSKLSIGSKITRELLGKLLSDMLVVKVESESTATEVEGGPRAVGDEVYGGDTMATEFGLNCLEDERLRNRQGNLSAVVSPSPDLQPSGRGGGSLDGTAADEAAARAQGQGGDDVPAGLALDDLEDLSRHRLCPTYASDINSPLRHVRTRIYFTSESHIHSLVNVLRYCHLRPSYTGPPLISQAAGPALDAEMDYLTHIVFRMYENMAVSVGDPARFRVEVQFSPGAGLNPLQHTPPDHALPVVPMIQLNEGTAESFLQVQDLLQPFSAARKAQPSSYALSVALKAPSAPISRKASSHTGLGSALATLAAVAEATTAPIAVPATPPPQLLSSGVLRPGSSLEQQQQPPPAPPQHPVLAPRQSGVSGASPKATTSSLLSDDTWMSDHAGSTATADGSVGGVAGTGMPAVPPHYMAGSFVHRYASAPSPSSAPSPHALANSPVGPGNTE